MDQGCKPFNPQGVGEGEVGEEEILLCDSNEDTEPLLQKTRERIGSSAVFHPPTQDTGESSSFQSDYEIISGLIKMEIKMEIVV